MPGTRSTLDGALKDLFLPVLAEHLNNDSMLANQLSLNTTQVSGRKAVFACHVSRNSGVGARGEGDNLPAAGNQGYVQANVGLAALYGRIEVSGHAMRTMKGGAGAYVSEPAAEIEGIETDLKRDWNRMLFGTGDGVIAATAATTASTTVNLAATTHIAALGQLAEGMVIDIGTVANPTAVASSRQVLSVNETAKTITISGAAVTTAATDRIFRAGAGGNQTNGGLTYGKETNGLGNVVDDSGVLHGIDPANYPTWKSYERDLAGTALSDNVIIRATHSIYRKSGSAPGLAITTDGVLRDYGDTLSSLKRTVNSVDLKGGFSAISVATGGGGKDVAITWDRDCPGGTVFMVDPSAPAMQLHSTGDWAWADDDGAVLSRVSNKDAYEAYLVRDIQLTTAHRNRHGKITGVLED